jgi:hypothetical protein
LHKYGRISLVIHAAATTLYVEGGEETGDESDDSGKEREMIVWKTKN